MQPVVFLDRDGVLNRPARISGGKAHAPLSRGELELYPSAAPSVARLREAGFLTVVVTNQPQVARGGISRDELSAMHAQLSAAVPVDEVHHCPHDDGDGCDCRKPLPGLLRRVLDRTGVARDSAYMVGDTWRDIEAGQRSGCFTILISRSYSGDCRPERRATSLEEAVDMILKREQADEAVR